MRKIIFMLIIMLSILLPLSVWAAPFLGCDPQTGVEKYRVNLPSAGIVNELSNAVTDGSARHDIGSWPAGTFNDGTIEAGAEYILNGQPQGVWEWSAPLPFDITKPSPNIVTNPGLSP